jgi:hypothetical protein
MMQRLREDIMPAVRSLAILRLLLETDAITVDGDNSYYCAKI